MSDRNYIEPQDKDEIVIDLHEILFILKKWSILILVMTALTTAAVGIYNFYYITPVYQAQTTLMVNQVSGNLATRAAQGGSLENVMNSVTTIPVWTMNTYVNQLTSPALNVRVVQALNQMGYPIKSITGLVSAAAIEGTNLIDVKVVNTNPETAAVIANTISSEFFKMTTERNQDQLAKSVVFIENQKKITDEELERVNQELQAYQSQPRGVSILDAELKSKSTDIIKHESRMQMIEVEISQTNNSMAALERELQNTPQFNVVERRNNATGNIEEVQETNRVYLTLSETLAGRKASLAEKQAEYESLAILIASLDQQLVLLQMELTEKRTHQEKLQRELNRLQETSDTLGKKSMETQIAKSIDFGETSLQVATEAVKPTTPIKPNKKLNLALALVIGMAVFTGLAFLVEIMNNTIKNADDVEYKLNLPVLGVMPKITANGMNSWNEVVENEKK